MTPEQFKRVDELFNAVRAIDPPARGAFLAESCPDVDVRREVEALLGFDEAPQDYLRTPALKAGMQFTLGGIAAPPWQRAHTPERIGAYRVIKVIGEGGFGVVYLAEQDNPRRTVALKVMKPHLASPQTMKRFEYEALVLGRLQHPGIAQIFEAGTSPGPHGVQAYYAMEFVNGSPLDVFARERKLSVRDRLELLARVCDAVQYAHQRGVIHRDLKPPNILVVEQGTKGRRDEGTDVGTPSSSSSLRPRTPSSLTAEPKVLDFGVAKILDADFQITTIRTSTGQFIGTLPYMSPEQVAGDPGDVDTRSDVYALGVILYQLLGGRLPFDFRTCSVPEAARRIRDESPPRLGTIDRALRGEVETIVAKALDKSKKRRYQSAADLALDIRRYLAGEPIEAKRDSALYVLRKQLRRHWAVVSAAAAFVILLGWFGVYASIQSRYFRSIAASEARARGVAVDALNHAEQERRRADRAAAGLAQQLSESNIERGRLFAQAGVVSSAEKLIWPEHLARPDSSHTYWALWDLYSREPWVATRTAHAGSTVALRFGPDCGALYSGGADGFLRVWEPEHWTCVAALPAHVDAVQSMDVSPDGRFLISSGRDGRIRLWRTDNLECVWTRPGYVGEINTARFIADGAYVIAGGHMDPAIAVWETATGALHALLPTAAAGIHSIAVAPNGRTAAATVRDGSILCWPDPVGEPENVVCHAVTRPFGRFCFSPDSRQFYICDDRVLRVWDIEQRRFVAVIQSPNDTNGFIGTSPSSGRLAVSGWWSINLWNPTTKTCERTLSAPEGSFSFAFSPDERCLAIGGRKGSLRIFELDPADARVRLDGHATRSVAALSPDGRRLAVGDFTGSLWLWDLASRALLAKWHAHDARVISVRFDPSGERLATGGQDRLVRIWDARSLDCVESFAGHYARTSRSLDWNRDGSRLAYMGSDYYIHIVDTQTWRETATFFLGIGEPLGVCFAHQSDIFATTTRDGPLRVWTPDGEALASIIADQTLWTADFSPDDQLIAAGNWGWSVDLYDWQEGSLVDKLEVHTATVWSVAFHPHNPRLLASCASDGTVRLFDVVDRRCLLTLDALSGSEVLSVNFDRDGRRLCAANSLGAAMTWDLGYFDRHIAGQLQHQGALGDEGPGGRAASVRPGAGDEDTERAAPRRSDDPQ